MRDQLVTHRTAVMAKRKGFNIRTPEYYDRENLLSDQVKLESWGTISKHLIYTESTDRPEDSEFTTYELTPGVVFAPTQSLLQKWLRDVHNIDVWAQPFVATGKDTMTPLYLPDETYSYYLFKDGSFVKDEIDCYDFEDALEKGLVEALKLIKK